MMKCKTDVQQLAYGLSGLCEACIITAPLSNSLACIVLSLPLINRSATHAEAVADSLASAV